MNTITAQVAKRFRPISFGSVKSLGARSPVHAASPTGGGVIEPFFRAALALVIVIGLVASASAESRTFQVVKGSGRGFTATVTLPEFAPDSKILAHLRVINRGDPWDRNGRVALHTPGGQVDLVKLITGFGGTTRHTVDVTNVRPLLKGKVTIEGRIEQSAAWGMDFHLEEVIGGNTGNPTVWTVPIIPSGDGFNQNTFVVRRKPYAQARKTYTIRIPTKSYKDRKVFLTYYASGHGGSDGRGCCEFHTRKHHIWVDGTAVFAAAPWRNKSTKFRNRNPRSGRFPHGWSSDFGRSGWLPGDVVHPYVVDVTAALADSKDGTHKIAYEVARFDAGWWVVSSYLSATAAPKKKAVQTMMYKARSKRTGNMWDTWLYHHKGTYYLFYLARRAGDRSWDNISMARSPDGVHWKEIGQVLSKDRDVKWMGTGSTWKSPNYEKDGKFFLNFSYWRGPRQTIFFAESKDLVNWTRLGNEYEFVQDERWYKKNGRWDCIWTIPRPGGGFYGYWSATPKENTGGGFGFGQSADGIKWEALPPPKLHGVDGGEVGAVEKIGGKYYMMFCIFLSKVEFPMVTLVADKPEGPFRRAKKNYRLLSGHTHFPRFFPSPDGMLVNHHSIARNGRVRYDALKGQVYFAPLKQAVVDKEGTLRLGWWKGNEKVKHRPVEVKLPGPGASREAPAMLRNVFDAKSGVILEGKLTLPKAKGGRRRGLYIDCGGGKGSAVLINSEGVAEVGLLKADGSGFKAEKNVNREMAFATPAKFRLLLKGSLMEFYLDDILIECYSLVNNATGKIGLIGGDDAFKDLKAWNTMCDEKGHK